MLSKTHEDKVREKGYLVREKSGKSQGICRTGEEEITLLTVLVSPPRDLVNIFRNNVRIIAAGSSFSGKTFLCINLLKKYIHKFYKIIIADCPNSHEFTKDDVLSKKIEIYNYIPSINELSMIYGDLHVIVIMDDNFNTSLNNKNVMEMFVRGRHKNISTLLITQNLLSKACFQRDISLNATHFILFKIRDLSQIQILTRQIYGKDYGNNIVNIYKYIQKIQKFFPFIN